MTPTSGGMWPASLGAAPTPQPPKKSEGGGGGGTSGAMRTNSGQNPLRAAQVGPCLYLSPDPLAYGSWRMLGGCYQSPLWSQGGRCWFLTYMHFADIAQPQRFKGWRATSSTFPHYTNDAVQMTPVACIQMSTPPFLFCSPDACVTYLPQQQRGFAAPPLESSPSEKEREAAMAAAASAAAAAIAGACSYSGDDVVGGLDGMMPTPADVRVPARVSRR